ncbi:hypothetical protein AB1Y20_021734 [Prymnesium parvum]|uniref:Uncharacterized protein n=1 Tax=Prymnesium parvum TaxID=97485 RepID=A0AB34JN27_PRYPA
MFSSLFRSRRASKPVGEPPEPSLELATEKAALNLPLDSSGQRFKPTGATSTEYALAFEELGLGVTAYMGLLSHWLKLAGICLVLSIPSMVSNGYGHALDDKQTSFSSWLFTVTTLGNTDGITPSYGATEFCISCVITISLFVAARELKVSEYRAEKAQITYADFALEVNFKPTAGFTVPEVKNCIKDAVKKALPNEPVTAEDPLSLLREPTSHVAVPVIQRSLKLLVEKYETLGVLIREREKARDELKAVPDVLSERAAKRLKKLEAALEEDYKTRKELAAQLLAANEVEGKEIQLAGVAYATMSNEKYVPQLMDKTLTGTIGAQEVTLKFRRPPEPTDIIWTNLGSTDSFKRQFIGTLACLVLSLMGSLIIGFTTLYQESRKDKSLEQFIGRSALDLFGTFFVIASYLSVFIFVPLMEEHFMRHRSITNREQSQVVKLVVFQVIAQIATSTVFLLQTGGAFTRDWYMTGGFLLINGMMVDLFVITVLVQGYQLNNVVIPQFVARYISPPLTQHEANILMAPKADMYVNDRLQMTTKFVCMTYIYASAMPMLWGILFAVCAVSQYVDTRNLLRILQPPPQSGVKQERTPRPYAAPSRPHRAPRRLQVRVILLYVMPVAALLHLIFQFFMLEELMDGDEDDDFLATVYSALGNLTSTAGDILGGVGASLANSSKIFGFEAGHSKGEDALHIVRLSILCNGPIVMFFLLNQWRRKLGLPSITDKLKVANMEKLVAEMGKEAAKVANSGANLLGEAARTEAKKTITEVRSAFQGLGRTVVGDDEFDPNKVKNEAAGVEFTHFCKVLHKPKLDPAQDPYQPPMPYDHVQRVVDRVRQTVLPGANDASTSSRSRTKEMI